MPAVARLRSVLTLTKIAFAVITFVPGGDARAQDADGEPADRSLGPYLYVGGGDPDTDRLPLKETAANIRVAGVIAHVHVRQVFGNAAKTPIEAVYVFPGSTRAAVHRLRMTIGSRVVEAKIDRKAQAAAAYERAKSEGRRASLLEEQRANVFTMNVANIIPGDRIAVDLEYSEMLIPEAGVYEVVMPSVVGPRYAGGTDPVKDRWLATAHLPAGTKEPYAYEVRAHLETGLPLKELQSPSHPVTVSYVSPSQADVRLREPGGGNRDYVLRFRLAGDRIEAGSLLSPVGPKGEGFFALMIEPPRVSKAKDAPPREYIFLVDVSGSMYGFPLDTAKALVQKLFAGLRSQDSFNIVLFAGGSRVLGPAGSLPATPANLTQALRLLDRERGGGGTELLDGLRASYGVPRPAGLGSRTVVVITDGYVGVESETFRFVRERLDQANLFAFGIGSGVNRAIIEGMARAGMGEPFVVLNAAAAPAAAERFRNMIERPLLTGIRVAFDGFAAFEQAPAKLPDLLAARPLILFGKYRGTGSGTATITGQSGTGSFRQVVTLDPAAARPSLQPLEWLWARKQVEWMEDERSIAQSPNEREALEGRIAGLGLGHSLLTSQTSFVAVDDVIANAGGRQKTSNQPLPMPAGVSNLAVASVSVSRAAMPPGDPVLTVAAAADALSVTAMFPFGLVKELAYDPLTERWQTRFLVPKQTPDGSYQVPVVIVHADGRIETVRGAYTIDSAAPDFDLEVEPVPGGVRIRVITTEPARRVTVAEVGAPDRRVGLTRAGDDATFAGTLSLPPGRHTLRVVVADRARNEADQLVTVDILR
jgi:Ca-activated chloride channel family protein